MAISLVLYHCYDHFTDMTIRRCERQWQCCNTFNFCTLALVSHPSDNGRDNRSNKFRRIHNDISKTMWLVMWQCEDDGKNFGTKMAWDLVITKSGHGGRKFAKNNFEQD